MKIHRVFPDPAFLQSSIAATEELRGEVKRVRGKGSMVSMAVENSVYFINKCIDMAESCFRIAAVRNGTANYRALKQLEKLINEGLNSDECKLVETFRLFGERLETVVIDTYSLMEVPLSSRAKRAIKKHEARIVELKLLIATHRSMIKDIKRSG